MRKKISTILCICLLIGVVSGCGSVESNLIEDSNAVAFEGSSESETADEAESDKEQNRVNQENAAQEKVEQTETIESSLNQKNILYAEDYLFNEVSELWQFSHYIHEKTGGQAYLQVERIRELDLQAINTGESFLRYYYSYYVSEVWPDHEEIGIWFFVRDDLGEILCREDDTDELYTLAEWRTSDRYADRMDAISQWQQEKIKLLLASEGEELDEPWYEAYRNIIIDWTKLEDYYDLGYLKFYFREDYQFDSYFLCDVDQNGIPELFLYSATGNMEDMVLIVSYTDQSVVIIYEMIYGINFKTKEVIVHGHWHGTGGTWINEWSGFQIQGDTFEFTMFIDAYPKEDTGEEEDRYYVSYQGRPDTEEQYTDRQEYEKIYAERVENCTPVEDIVKYALTDLSGLKHIQ